MTPAPALTWLALFPFGTALDCREVPAWFRDLVRPDTEAGALGRALVLFAADAKAVAEKATGMDGLVVVNGRRLSQAAFAKAGFGYARRFAAVPNLANARWFVPLDTPAVTSAGFGLYSPARKIARLKLAAVRSVARLGVGGWYRDDVWVAARTEPPLERLVRRVLPGHDIRLALSAGAPEPARNRKVSAAVIGTDGRTLAFVKLPTSPLATRLVRQEAEALDTLAQRLSPDAGLVPRLLFAGESDGRYALLQAPLIGRPTTAKLTPQHRRFLNALRATDQMQAATESAFFQDLVARVGALGNAADDLTNALRAITPTLARTRVPSTVIHGDFAPWNVRLCAGSTSVCAFDWEYGVIDGLPLIDETHFELQVGFQIHHWSPERAAHELNARSHVDPDWPADTVRALQAVYFVDSIARLLEEGYAADDEMMAWYRRTLAVCLGQGGPG